MRGEKRIGCAYCVSHFDFLIFSHGGLGVEGSIWNLFLSITNELKFKFE